MGIKRLNLRKFSANDNSKITDVSWMKNLKELNAFGNCGIDQLGIKGLNLIELYVRNNPKITDVSWMQNLKIFDSNLNI